MTENDRIAEQLYDNFKAAVTTYEVAHAAKIWSAEEWLALVRAMLKLCQLN